MSNGTKEIKIRPLNISFIEEACKHKIEFLIVGGAAAAYYGCRNYDEVDDLDLMINPTRDNAGRLVKLLNAQTPNACWSEDSFVKPNRVIPIKNTFYLDILTPPTEDINFLELLERCENSLIGLSKVKVISRVDLIDINWIALKREKVELEKQKAKLEKLSRDLSCLEAV